MLCDAMQWDGREREGAALQPSGKEGQGAAVQSGAELCVSHECSGTEGRERGLQCRVAQWDRAEKEGGAVQWEGMGGGLQCSAVLCCAVGCGCGTKGCSAGLQRDRGWRGSGTGREGNVLTCMKIQVGAPQILQQALQSLHQRPLHLTLATRPVGLLPCKALQLLVPVWQSLEDLQQMLNLLESLSPDVCTAPPGVRA